MIQILRSKVKSKKVACGKFWIEVQATLYFLPKAILLTP